MTAFAYLGHETVGAYVAKQLSAASLNAVDDVRSADVVITYFTHASALEDAYFEEEGIVKNARKGTMLIDLSPSTLSVSRGCVKTSSASCLAMMMHSAVHTRFSSTLRAS